MEIPGVFRRLAALAWAMQISLQATAVLVLTISKRGDRMNSPTLARLWGCAVLLTGVLWQLPGIAAAEVGATPKPPERCVPRHLYAQPECWRNLPESAAVR